MNVTRSAVPAGRMACATLAVVALTVALHGCTRGPRRVPKAKLMLSGIAGDSFIPSDSADHTFEDGGLRITIKSIASGVGMGTFYVGIRVENRSTHPVPFDPTEIQVWISSMDPRYPWRNFYSVTKYSTPDKLPALYRHVLIPETLKPGESRDGEVAFPTELGATKVYGLELRFRGQAIHFPDGVRRAVGDDDGERAPSEPPAEPGCMKDSECKGDRICEKGRCVSPK